jgi:hypothetical protein
VSKKLLGGELAEPFIPRVSMRRARTKGFVDEPNPPNHIPFFANHGTRPSRIMSRAR